MPLQMIRDDITTMNVDAIVNAANQRLQEDGGVGTAIYRAAGPRLNDSCHWLHNCPVGSAKITKGYGLPCQYTIHAVGPVWQGGDHGEREQLASCYKAALELAYERGCKSVAFPVISAGFHGYPIEEALQVAVDAIGAFLLEHEMEVYIVMFQREYDESGREIDAELDAYIDDNYVALGTDDSAEQLHMETLERQFEQISALPWDAREAQDQEMPLDEAGYRPAVPTRGEKTQGVRREEEQYQIPLHPRSVAALEAAMREMDESFAEMLLRKIDENGMKDSDCYKKANVSRQLFSKIRSDRDYKPKKPTAVAFIMALELPIEEANVMLAKAGYAFSRSDKFDIIVQFLIQRKLYNVNNANLILFKYHQALLGSGMNTSVEESLAKTR